MSDPIQEYELSALIDGELDPARAGEARSQLAHDPVLWARYERLLAVDGEWRQAAQTARFVPAINLPPEPARPGWLSLSRILGLFAMLTAGRFALKLLPVDLVAGMLIHAVMLGVTIAVVVWFSNQARTVRLA